MNDPLPIGRRCFLEPISEIADAARYLDAAVSAHIVGRVQQHAAFQAMCVQYDHLLAHARGGANDLENMLITCAPCNYCRAEYTFAEVGLLDPLRRKPFSSTWDGLERFRNA